MSCSTLPVGLSNKLSPVSVWYPPTVVFLDGCQIFFTLSSSWINSAIKLLESFIWVDKLAWCTKSIGLGQKLYAVFFFSTSAINEAKAAIVIFSLSVWDLTSSLL